MSAKADRPAIKVADVMTPKPICVTRGTSVAELAEVFDANEISGAPVLDEQDRVVGVVSKTDLIHRCVEGPIGAMPGDLSAFLGLTSGVEPFPAEDLGTVEDFMTTDLVTAEPEEPIGVVARRMAEERVHRIVVVDEHRRAIGIITALDVLDTYPS